MKVFVVKILVEDIDLNSCSVKVFSNFEAASKYANDEIDTYGEEYDGNVTERASHHLTMNSGDTYVTIDIEEQDVVEESPVEELPDRLVKVDWDTDVESPEELGLPDVVNVPGFVPDEGVADYCSDIYGFCVKSWIEQFHTM